MTLQAAWCRPDLENQNNSKTQPDRESRSGPNWDSMIPQTEAFIAPAIVFCGCVGTGETPATTGWATIIFAAIFIGTYLAGRRHRG